MKLPKKLPKKQEQSLGLVNVDTAGLRTPFLIVTGVALFGFGYWWISGKIQKQKRNNALANSVEAGTPQNTAVKLQSVIGSWFGDWTDSGAITLIFSNIKSQKEYESVVKEYGKITSGRLLYDDLVWAVGKTETQKLLDMISQKPEKQGELPAVDSSKEIAQRIKEAIEYWDLLGQTTHITNLFDAILLIPEKTIYEKTKISYKNITGKDMWADIENESNMSASVWDWNFKYKASAGGTYLEKLKTEVIKKFGNI